MLEGVRNIEKIYLKNDSSCLKKSLSLIIIDKCFFATETKCKVSIKHL